MRPHFNAKPVAGYASPEDAVLALARENKSREEIAAAIGRDLNTVSTVLCNTTLPRRFPPRYGNRRRSDDEAL